MHNLNNKSDQSAIEILTENVGKSKKRGLPNIKFILILFPEDKLIFVWKGLYFKDTCRENVPSNNTKALTKSMDMDIWIIGTK